MIDEAWRLSKRLVWGYVLLVALLLLIGHVITEKEKEDYRSGTIGGATQWEEETTEVSDPNSDTHSSLL